jgi:hypothetical protein
MKSFLFRHAGATVLVLALLTVGCRHKSAGEDAQPSPQLIQKDGQSYLEFRPEDMAGLESIVVKEVDLPAVLETTGQVTFDDRLVKTITSRVSGSRMSAPAFGIPCASASRFWNFIALIL